MHQEEDHCGRTGVGLHLIADRLEHGEAVPSPRNVIFIAA
jgi:hypothetical protein